MNQNIFGVRLKNARVMSQLSMDELVDKMDGLVTKQAVSKYERGVMQPSRAVVEVLSNVLNQHEGYFYKPFTFKLESLELRSKTTLSKKIEDAIIVKVQEDLEKYLEIEDILGLNSEYQRPMLCQVEDFENIPSIARSLKEQWALGTEGIISVTAIFEEHNVKVVLMDLPEIFDGISGWAGSKPFIVLNSNISIEWKRFVLLREYAHIVLTFKDNFTPKGIEKYCIQFASELMISCDLFIDLIGMTRNNIYLNEVVDIQSRFGIPIMIIIEKARNLNIISEAKFKKFVRTIKKSETLRKRVNKSIYLCEYSGRFDSLICRALSSGLLTVEKAAILSNRTIEELNCCTETII